MGLHYLTFMGRNLKNKKKLTFVQIMNSVGMNNNDIMSHVSTFNDSVAINNNFIE